MAQNFLSDIKLGDNIYIRLGDGTDGDLRLYHNATHSYIDGANTGDLYIRSLSDDVVIQGADDVFIYTQGGEDAIIARGDGGVEIFYDNSKKLETANTGIVVTGNADPATDSLYDLGTNTVRWANVYADTLHGDGSNITGVAADKSQAVTLTVKNKSGGSLSKGTIVHAHPSVSPPSGNVIEVIAADNDDTTKMPAIGILNATLADEAEGEAIMFGRVSGISTTDDGTSTGTLFSIGDELYVSSTPGLFTNVKPTGTKLIQKIAVVIKSHATNGTIEVFGAGRTNDVPTPIYIDHANQEVGIGQTSPDTKLHITDTSSAFQFTVDTGTAGDGRLNIGHFSNGTFIGTYGDDGGAADLIRFGTHSGDERMRILSDGKVFIGKTSTGLANIGVEFDPTGQLKGTASNVVVQYLNRTTSDGAILEFRKDNSAVGSIGSTTSYLNSSLGIGETNPSAKLEVKGTAGLMLLKTSTGNAFYVEDDTNYAKAYLYQIGGGVKIQLNTNGDSYFNGGNVGIGTATPSRKLDVVGGYFRTSDATSGTQAAFVQGGTSYAYFGNLGSGPAAFGNSENYTTLIVDGENATFAGDVTVGGDLIVNGTTTTINTATVEVEDNILQLNTTQGSPDTATATTSGISIYRGDGVTQASFIFDDADDTWDLTNNLAVAGNVNIENTSSTTNDSVNVLDLKSLSSGTTANGFGVGLGFFTENSTYSTVNEIGRIEVVETNEALLNDKMIFYVKDNNTLTERLNITGSGATFAGTITVDGGQILTPSAVNLALNPNTGVVTVGGVIQASGTGNNTFAGSITTNLSAEGTYFTGGSGGVRQLSITSGTNVSAHALHTFNIASSNGKYEFEINSTPQLTLDSSSATFAGVLALPDGSASAPSIGNTGDTNTGMYWPGDHQLGFAVNGSRKFYMSETEAFFQNLSSGVSINAGGIDVTGNSTFAGSVDAAKFVLPSTGTTTPLNKYLFTNNTNTGTGRLIIQAGEGSAGYGGAINLFSHSHATKPGWVTAGISSGSGGKFSVNTQGLAGGTDVFTVDTSGNATFAGNIQVGGFTGHIIPSSDSSYDIGQNSVRVANIYADTLYGDGSNITNVNATTLDSVDSTSFLRSDADDTYGSHTLTIQGVVRSTNNANVDGPNFNVSTTNKSVSEYAYRVDRSGTIVGGILIGGKVIGAGATFTDADVVVSGGNILHGDSTSIYSNGSYLEIGTGANNSAQITFNADYDGGSSATYTPHYAGASSAGMSIIKMPSGGVGGLEFHVKNHGTTSGSHALSTFTKILDLNQDGNATFAGSVETEGPDGGLVLRNWQASASYGMLGTANMANSEYAVLTDGTHTYISGGAGGNVSIRAGNNDSAHQLIVSSASAEFDGNVNIDDSLAVNFDYDAANNYLYLRKHQTTDGGIVFQSKTSGGSTQNDFQILNNGTTGDLSFYAYGLGAFALIIDREDGNATFAGDVTVGALTSGQTAQLVINHEGGATPVAKFMSRTNRAQVQIGDNDTNGYLVAEADVFSIGRTASASANNINIDASHNVGIGTTSPSGKLDIVGPSNGDVILRLQRDGVGSYDCFVTDAGEGAQQLFFRSNPTDSGFIFQTKNSAGTNLNAMIIAPSGNVGIGTTSPDSILQIANNDGSSYRFGYGGTSDVYLDADNIYIRTDNGGSNTATFTTTGLGIGTTSPGAKLDIHTATNSNGLLIREDTDDSITHNFYIDSADNGLVLLYANGQSAKIQLNTAGDSYFDGGNVGIGVTSPGHKLDVSGNIRLQGGNRKIIYNNGSVETSLDQVAGATAGLFTLGNVGIGTATPSNKVHIYASDGSSYLRFTSDVATTGSRIGLNSDDLIIENQQATGDMIFDTAATERMRIESDGKIDISGFGTEGCYIKSKGSIRLDIDADNDHTDRAFIISSNNAASDLITVTETGNTTFAGTVTANDDLILDNSSPEIYFKTGATHYNWMIAAQENISAALEFTPANAVGTTGTHNAPALTLYADRNATFAGNVDLDSDSTKLRLGDGQDLSIYYNGTNGFITYGTSGLYIQGDYPRIQSSGGENMIAANVNAEVNLYFNNVNKFQTTSYGTNTSGRGTIVDTTNPGGDGTASGGGVLTVEGRRDGTANVLTLRARDESAPAVALPDGQGSIVRWQGFDGTDFAQMGAIAVLADGQAVANSDAPSKMVFYTVPDATETLTTALTLDKSQNATFAGNVIIDNTSSGDATLTLVTTTGGDPTIVMNSDAANRSGLIKYQDNGTNIGRIQYVHNGDKLQFQAGSATGQILELTNSTATFAGTVTVGTGTVAAANAAADDFVITGPGTTATGMTISNSSDAGTGTIFFGDTTNSSVAGFRYNHNTGDMAISAEDNITFACDNVGIGTTSPATKLDINSGISTSSTNVLSISQNTTGAIKQAAAFGVAIQNGGEATNAADLTISTASGGSLTQRMRITSTGLVGIGCTPSRELDVENSTDHSIISVVSGTTNLAGVVMGDTDDDDRGAIIYNNSGDYLYFLTSASERMRLESDGDLHVDGDVIAYSTTISDNRLKDDVITIDNALDKVSKLRGVEYTWNATSRKGQKDIGVIAQEVEEVIPEIVREKEMPLVDGGKYKTVDYEKLTAVLIEAVKELKAEVEELKNKCNDCTC